MSHWHYEPLVTWILTLLSNQAIYYSFPQLRLLELHFFLCSSGKYPLFSVLWSLKSMWQLAKLTHDAAHLMSNFYLQCTCCRRKLSLNAHKMKRLADNFSKEITIILTGRHTYRCPPGPAVGSGQRRLPHSSSRHPRFPQSPSPSPGWLLTTTRSRVLTENKMKRSRNELKTLSFHLPRHLPPELHTTWLRGCVFVAVNRQT